jgi:hypothetical protein
MLFRLYYVDTVKLTSIYQRLTTMYLGIYVDLSNEKNANTKLLLILKSRNQSPNIRLQLDAELIPGLEELRHGLLRGSHTGGSTREDDRSCWEGCSLRKEAD